jgi:two-component system sensor kinase FixL
MHDLCVPSHPVRALVCPSEEATLLLSPELAILATSEACLRLLGVNRDEISGRDVRQVFDGSDSLDALTASVDAAAQTDRRHRVTPGLFKTTEGHHRQLLEVVSSPIRIAGARLRSIMRTVPDAMIIIDEHGLIEALSVTAERLFGYTAEEVSGKNIKLLVPSPHRELHDRYLERYPETGERRIIGIGRIVVGQRKDGTTFPMHSTIGEMQSGDAHYFTGFIRDGQDQRRRFRGGLSPAVRAHLFQPFVTTKQKGMAWSCRFAGPLSNPTAARSGWMTDPRAARSSASPCVRRSTSPRR